MYDYDIEQAIMRLSKTIVLYKGVPVYVHEVRNGGNKKICLLIYDLPRMNQESVVQLDDKDLDVFNFSLGYLNTEREVKYLLRNPRRQNRQGLDANNTAVIGRNGLELREDFSLIYRQQGFVDMFANKYPSIEKCQELLKNGADMQAFHKHFALELDHDLDFYLLYYKGNRVAYGDIDNLVLPSHMMYLNEVATNAGIKVRA